MYTKCDKSPNASFFQSPCLGFTGSFNRFRVRPHWARSFSRTMSRADLVPAFPFS